MKYNPDLPILEYKLEDGELSEKQLKHIKYLEIEHKIWEKYISELISINFGFRRSTGYVLGREYDEWEDLIKEELLLNHNVKISKGYNYQILEMVIREGLNYIFRNHLKDELSYPTEFIPSIRALPKRFISHKNEDSYLDNLINQIGKIEIHQKEYFQKWIKEFGIADEVVFNHISEAGVTVIQLIKDKKKFNLSDVGYGFSQLLPIIIRLCLFEDKELIIEEPETNLHPALQSKLADMFAFFIKDGKKIILETHSEYLIRKLQYLVAKKEFNKEDCIIYYFNSKENINKKEPQVKKIEITDDGNLTENFSPGFFDESTRLQFDLMLLNKSQMN